MEALRRIRKDQGLSLRALGEKSGVSADAIFHIEHGKRSPKAETLEKLSRALGVGVETLLSDPTKEDWRAGVTDLDALEADDLIAVFRARSDRWQRLKKLEASLSEGSSDQQQATAERKRAHSRVLDAMSALMSRPDITINFSAEEADAGITMALLGIATDEEGMNDDG